MRSAAPVALVLIALCITATSERSSLSDDYPFVERVTVSSEGEGANRPSFSPAISADGRFVSFDSLATNLVPGDTNLNGDVFVRDRVLGTTERVSVSSAGDEADSISGSSALSSDGRFVVFDSPATNLVPGVDDGESHVYVHDREDGTTEEVVEGLWAAVSADLRFVAFYMGVTQQGVIFTNFYLHDRDASETVLANVDSNGDRVDTAGFIASVSEDGRFVLVELDPGDGSPHGVYIFDRDSGATERVDVTAAGQAGNDYSLRGGMSGDGRFVTFWSVASDLVADDGNGAGFDLFLRDRETGRTTRLTAGLETAQNLVAFFQPIEAPLSADGRYVAFIHNGLRTYAPDLYVYDTADGMTRSLGLTETMQEVPMGFTSQFRPLAMSGDGRFVAVESLDGTIVSGDTNLESDIFVYDVSQLPEIEVTPGGVPSAGGPAKAGEPWSFLAIGALAALVGLASLALLARLGRGHR